MPGLKVADMADVVIAVNDAFPSPGSFEYLFSDAEYAWELINRLFQEKRILIKGGENISAYVVYREQGTAEFVEPTQTYQPGIVNVMKKVTIPWAHAHMHWSVVDEEIFACREPEEVVDIILPRRQSAQMGLALLIELQFYAAPDASDSKLPLTIPYWIVPITTTQVAAGTTLDGAFQGANPTGYNDVAGLDASDATYARWRNWNALWDNMSGEYTATNEKRMGRVFRHLNFQTPITVKDLEKPAFNFKRIHTNETTLESMEASAKAQNDNVGRDLARFQGATLFKGLPVAWIKALDTYSASRGYYPTFFLNTAKLRAVVRSGDFFRSKTFPANSIQPDLTTTHEDVSYNIWCPNRQAAGAVLSGVA